MEKKPLTKESGLEAGGGGPNILSFNIERMDDPICIYKLLSTMDPKIMPFAAKD